MEMKLTALCGPRNGNLFAILRLVFPVLDVAARAYVQLLGPLWTRSKQESLPVSFLIVFFQTNNLKQLMNIFY